MPGHNFVPDFFVLMVRSNYYLGDFRYSPSGKPRSWPGVSLPLLRIHVFKNLSDNKT